MAPVRPLQALPLFLLLLRQPHLRGHVQAHRSHGLAAGSADNQRIPGIYPEAQSLRHFHTVYLNLLCQERHQPYHRYVFRLPEGLRYLWLSLHQQGQEPYHSGTDWQAALRHPLKIICSQHFSYSLFTPPLLTLCCCRCHN